MNKHQPESGHDIEKLLTEITPQADVHFQEKLERQVLAAYLQKKEGDKVKANGHLVTYADFVPQLRVNKNRQHRWSISLAATLLMVFFVGLTLMSIRGKPQDGYTGASLITTPTSTPTPTSIATVPVVVASQDLKGNQIIRFSDVKIQDYPADQAPKDAFSDINEVIGAQLLTNVLVGRPILEGSISSERVFIDFDVESPVGYLGDPVVVAYPRGSLMVNVRASPDTNSEILGQMEQGTGYVVINRNEDWYQILYTASERGWVLQNFVFTRGNTTSVSQITIPIVDPLPMDGFSFVVVVVRDLQRGTLITPDMLEVQQWRSNAVPITSFTRMEDLIGAITKTDIPSESPILESQVFLPDELTAMGLPFEVYIGLKPVVMTNQAIQRDTVITEAMLTVVYWSSELVTAEMYDTIDAIVGQMLVTDLRPYSPILTDYLALEPEDGGGTEIAAGNVAIAVPLPDDAYFYGFQVGDTISITASFLFIDANEVNGIQTPPSPVLPEGVVVEPTDTANPQLVIQEVIPDAKIIGLNVAGETGDMVMILAVTPQDAVVLTWLIDAGIPIQYRIVAPVPSVEATE